MLVGILDRDIKLFIQSPNSSKHLHTRIKEAKLTEIGTNTNIILLVILYPQETVQELEIDSSNTRFIYVCSFLQGNGPTTFKIDSEVIHSNVYKNPYFLIISSNDAIGNIIITSFSAQFV